MDVDTRYNTRLRAQTHLHKGILGMQDDSGGESESNLVRRKFARTSTDPAETDTTFRKPSLPASATRPSGLEHRPSLNQRRRSTLRENVRVPSGPRDFPSPSKQRLASNASITPSVDDSTNTRPFLPQSNSESFVYNSRAAGAASMSRERLGFARPAHSSTDSARSPTTPADGSNGTRTFEFLPDINFDDFQTSIKNYDGTSPMLSDFPSLDGGRILPGEEDYTNTSMARSNGFASSARREEQQPQKQQGMTRTQSLRQRLGAGRQASGGQPGVPKDTTAESKSSLRNRRQSTVPPSNAAQATTITPAASRPPRKSVGPGLLTSMMKSGGQSGLDGEEQQKSSLIRSSSLSKARRTTIQPPASAGAEGPRPSTLTATTQSRQNKVKSLQPPPKPQDDPNSTPSSTKSGKNGQNRAHTPSSGSGRRQSMASGRASGLGARTISPTDARRLKRMSVNPPPMPTAYLGGKTQQPSPAEELQNPMNNIPRMAQPSPSLIPRKASNATPASSGDSPEGKMFALGGVSLNSKSSFSSLANASANGSSSRLPTPKSRNGGQSGSAMGQYTERQYGDAEYSEMVPPVPAIPKAFESPQDEDHRPFFSSLKSSQSENAENAASTGWTEVSSLPAPQRISQTPRGSLDVPAETPRKRSGEFPRHRRTNTGNSGVVVPSTPGPPKTASRAQPDPNGRKNANLQPLRLPPLNLMPVTTRTLHSSNTAASFPRPSLETDQRDPTDWSVQTPEPKRNAKTPSTPMTASKATFFRRQDEKAIRSSSSHYALRDVMGMDDNGNMTTRYWDDSDVESASRGVPIPNAKQPRSAITPFASGSLPKGSGEFARQMRARPSGEYEDDPYSLGAFEGAQWQSTKPLGPRQRTGTQTTVGSTSMKSLMDAESTSINDAPSLPEPKKEVAGDKKEGGGLRRKLSLGWRRSSSKAASHADNKSSPQQENGEKHEKNQKLQKRANDMPPPKLPASATWSGEVPSLPSKPRLTDEQNSLLGHARRKSQLPASVSQTSLPSDSDHTSSSGHVGGVKTRALHSEHPTPVSANTRASSWGNMGANSRAPPPKTARHKLTSSTLSANVKDKDDYAADDEMARLSRKRKDVDSAARETEEIKKRAIPRQPVSAESVLHDRSLLGGSQLNVFERGEIVDYEKEGIYFTGTRSARKVIGSLTSSPLPGKDGKDAGGVNNFGYDDERGDYNIVLGDHLAYRYEVVDVLGKGSFGQVVRCVDHKEGGVVAVKIIRNKKRFHQQALVEVGILGRLRDWDPDGAHATLSITSSFYFRSHLCIVTPCLSINLYELIRAHNFTGFTLPLIRRFSRQLLATLVLLQSKRIIHCDLKPENILLCEARKADVRVIDFGSSCREEEKVYTYIQSRFYRSPEVILGSSYGLGIDMWSFGCILAELWTGYPIFPGENEQEQLACIMEVFGPPDRHLVERCTRKKLFFDSVGKPRVTVSSKGRRRRPSSKTLQQALKSDDDAFLDFITRCLRWDPDRRLKPHDAVNHPFITNQPFNQRQGIPEEARRAARVRSSAAVPTTSTVGTNGNGGIPSPVKRGNAFTQATPAKEKRGQAETPQTAVRNGIAAAAATQGSPSKLSSTNVGGGGNRWHSTLPGSGTAAPVGGPSAASAAVAGSKRASNGAVLLSGGGGIGAGATRPLAQNGVGGAGGSGNLAALAARESMGAAANTSSSSAGGVGARWKA